MYNPGTPSPVQIIYHHQFSFLFCSSYRAYFWIQSRTFNSKSLLDCSCCCAASLFSGSSKFSRSSVKSPLRPHTTSLSSKNDFRISR